jgi:hypothetical protein
MKLKDYILEYVSSGRRKPSRKGTSISIGKDITLKEFIDMLEELGYSMQDEPMGLFTRDNKNQDIYAIRSMPNSVTRVLVKNIDKSESVYMRVVFVSGRNIKPWFVYLDGDGDVDTEPADLDSLEKYLTGL